MIPSISTPCRTGYLKYCLLLLLFTACRKSNVEAEDPFSRIQSYFDINDPESFYYITSMAESTDGSIVFGAFTSRDGGKVMGSGLYRFREGNTEPIDTETTFQHSSTYRFERIVVYEKDNLLFKYDPDEYAGHEWSVTDLNDRRHSSSCQKDVQGNLWIASRKKSSYDNYRNGILMYDGSAWRHLIPEWKVWSLCFDRTGNVYANTLPESRTANEETGVILKYTAGKWDRIAEAGYITVHYPADPVSGKPTDPQTFLYPSAWFSSMYTDLQDNLWAGTLQRSFIGTEYGCGLYRMGLNGELKERYMTDNSGIPSNSVVSIRADDRENIWVGTYNGGMARLSAQGKWDAVTLPIPKELWNIEHILVRKGSVYSSVQFTGIIELIMD